MNIITCLIIISCVVYAIYKIVSTSKKEAKQLAAVVKRNEDFQTKIENKINQSKLPPPLPVVKEHKNRYKPNVKNETSSSSILSTSTESVITDSFSTTSSSDSSSSSSIDCSSSSGSSNCD